MCTPIVCHLIIDLRVYTLKWVDSNFIQYYTNRLTQHILQAVINAIGIDYILLFATEKNLNPYTKPK